MADAVVRLTAGLCREGHAVTLATVADGQDEPMVTGEADGVRRVLYRPSVRGGGRYSETMRHGLKLWVESADVVHVHGAWTFPVWWGCRQAIRTHRPLVRSPHGSFMPVALRKSAWRKRLFGCGFEKPLLRRTDCVHAASDLEAAAMRAYGCRALIQVIPNPVEPIGAPPDAQARVDRLFPELRGAPYVLALGRMHPMKGLDLLVEAWSRVNREFPDWRLWIVGPDEAGTADRLRRQIRQAGMDQRIRLGGAVHGDDKQALLAQAGLFVLPSRTENFGMVVAEALSAGVPVIATRATPWRALDANDGGNSAPEKCGWWVETSVEGLAGGLRAAIGMDASARRSLGAGGNAWVLRTFNTQSVCRRMSRLYEETVVSVTEGGMARQENRAGNGGTHP